jgi:hypothetical protein
VLVDDQLRHAGLWRDAGGIFIHHRNAGETLKALADYFPLGASEKRQAAGRESGAQAPAASR